MSGTLITLWNNYMESQGPLYENGPNDVYNNAALFKRWSTGRLMGGGKNKRANVGVGGSEIRFSTFFETGEVTKHVQPGETRQWSQPQKLLHGTLRKRYRETHMAWTRQVIMDNEGMRAGNFDQYVNHRRHLEQMMETDYWNFDERHLWRKPDYTEMESGNAVEGWFYSVPAFINEFTNNLYNNSGTAGTQWTTIEGFDPTSTTRGQNRFVHNTVVYSNAITNVTGGVASIVGFSTVLSAMERAWMAIDWSKPPKNGEYFDDISINNQTIFCSPQGQIAYAIALRASQDALVHQQDAAYNSPSFNGIPLFRADVLTEAPIYPAGSITAITNTVSEHGTKPIYGGGPRYYFINSDNMFPFYDPDMFFERGEVRNHYNDPDTFVQPVFLWGNLMCTRRDVHCLIRPGRDNAVSLYAPLYA
jgi:hypothetical protein